MQWFYIQSFFILHQGIQYNQSMLGSVNLPVFLFALVFIAASINIPCSTLTPCPNNSFCNSNNYCQCETGWALDCNLASTVLTPQFVDTDISSKPISFTIVPSDTTNIFIYRFQMCTNISAQLDLQLFADEGVQDQLSRTNLIGSLQVPTAQGGCWTLFSPYMQFGTQPNGNIEQMIFSIELVGKQISVSFGKDTVEGISIAPKQEEKLKLKIKVQQFQFISKTALWIFIITFIVIISLSLILGIAYCIYAIRRGPNRFIIDNDIKYFDKLLPKYKIKENDQYLNVTCSICLLQFQLNNKVRKTPCNHVFHDDCLDIWCKKNLSCPVCRTSLKKKEIQQKLRKVSFTSSTNSCQFSHSYQINLETTEENNRKKLREPLEQTQ